MGYLLLGIPMSSTFSSSPSSLHLYPRPQVSLRAASRIWLGDDIPLAYHIQAAEPPAPGRRSPIPAPHNTPTTAGGGGGVKDQLDRGVLGLFAADPTQDRRFERLLDGGGAGRRGKGWGGVGGEGKVQAECAIDDLMCVVLARDKSAESHLSSFVFLFDILHGPGKAFP